jgi:hypothetical protein
VRDLAPVLQNKRRVDVIGHFVVIGHIDFRALRWLVLSMIGAAALVIPLVAHAGASSGAVLATDSFSRVSAAGWQSADTGGAYMHPTGASEFRVNGTSGTITLAVPGTGVSADLTAVSSRDVELHFRVALDRAPTGAGSVVSALMRRSPDAEYRAQLRLGANGSVSVAVLR